MNGAGAAKAVVSNQRVIVRSPLGSEASRKIFGRSGPAGNALVVLAAGDHRERRARLRRLQNADFPAAQDRARKADVLRIDGIS